MGGSQVYVGVDVHKNYSWVCAMDEKIFFERRIRSEELEDVIKEIPGNKTVILEPTTVTMPIATRIRKAVNVKHIH